MQMGRVETSASARSLGLAATVRHGGRDAPVLVFVHGLGASRQDWAEAYAFPRLEPYTLLAVDLPGFGESPPIEPFTFAAVAELLARLVEPVAGRAVIVGHSMGGAVASLLAERVPPLQGVVLVETVLLEQEEDEARLLDFDSWFTELLEECDLRAQADVSLARYVQSLRRLHRPTYAAAWNELGLAGRDRGVGRRYAALRMPRVYVAGRGVGQECFDFLEQHELAVRRFPEAGHAIMIDEPLDFYAFLADWTADVLDAPPAGL